MTTATNLQAAIVLIIRETNIPRFPVGFRREVLAVTNRRYNTLTLPGGKVDPEETPLVAVIRETMEEVNLHLAPQDLTLLGQSLSVNARQEGDRHVMVSFYYARCVTGTASNVEQGTDIIWCPFDELLSRSYFAPFYSKHLPEGINHLPSTKFVG